MAARRREVSGYRDAVTRASATERTALLATLALLGALPVASGTVGITRSTAGLPGGSASPSTVDSEYRFLNVFWAAAGGVVWWSLRRPEERASATRLVLALAATGGLPRLLSWVRTGPPHPVFRATLVLELVVVPAVLWWHRRVLGSRRS